MVHAQSDPADYWLNNGFTDGQTVITNSGKFYDDGGFDTYAAGQDWEVRFCSENGNPITLDFSGFRTHYAGTHVSGDWENWDYMTINFPGNNYVAYDFDTPQFSFTAPDGCITFGLFSQLSSPGDSGWVAEISANPPPANNDPCTAANLVVGNVCAPEFFSNKGAYNTTSIGSPPCHTYFGGDVWFRFTVPASGQVKIQSLPGSLTYAIMDIFSSTSCSSLTRITCAKNINFMPVTTLIGRTPGEIIYVRIFGDQAKSGTFGMCVTDPSAPVTGFTGPGGVGDSVTNTLWLRADTGVLNGLDIEASNTEEIKTWNDFSGNKNNLVQNTLSMRPLLNSAGINSSPAIVFDGFNDRYFKQLEALSAPLMLFAVSSFSSNVNQSLLSLGDANITNTFSISRDAGQNYYSFTGAAITGPSLSQNTPYLLQARHASTLPFHRLKIGVTSQTVNDYPAAVATDGSFNLGSNYLGTDPFNGMVSEIILYNTALNSAQELIVTNYLAAKYGFNLGAGDIYAWDPAFKNDVAGIGRINVGNTHTKAQSAGMLSIGGASDLENNEFLLFGHDGGDISSWSSVNVPDSDPNIVRLARTWRVDQSGGDGTVGQLSISLDSTKLPPLNPGFIAYNVFVSSNPLFTSGSTSYGLIHSGSELIANNVILNDGDYIIIGIVKPYVSFDLPASEGFESIHNPSISLSLNYAISTLMEVNYNISGGTAGGAGLDYSLNPDIAVFNPGQKTALIQPTIIDDDIVEIPDEYFDISLSAPTAGVITGVQDTHRYTIKNNDVGIVISASQTSIGECATSSSVLTATPTGTGPFTFLWSPSAGLSDPGNSITNAKPASSTVYKVTVTDANGFSSVDSVAITVVPALTKPLITAGGSLSFCTGDSVLLSTSISDSYLWSNSATTQSIYVKTSGSYNVIAYDGYACPSPVSDNTVVTVNTPPSKPAITSSGSTTFCSGGSVDLLAPLSSSYLWSNGSTTQSITVSSAGSYTVQVSDGTCQSIVSDAVIVTVNTPPSKAAIAASGSTTFCSGGSVELTAPLSASYLWSNGSITQSITVSSAGSYTVQVSDGTCLSEASDPALVTVLPIPEKPVITPDGPLTFLTGGSVTLSSSAASGNLWSPGGENTQNIVVSSSGFYSVSVIDANNCNSESSDITEVVVKTNLDKPLITLTGDTELCEGEQVILTSEPAFSYEWSTGAVTQSISVTESGLYSLFVRNADGILSEESDAVEVSVNSNPLININSNDVSCFGGSDGNATVDIISGSGTIIYLWSNNAATKSISGLAAGTFNVTVSDGNGCKAMAATIISQPAEILLSADISDASCPDASDGQIVIETTGGVGSYTFEWSNGANSNIITELRVGNYGLTVTDASLCVVNESFDLGYQNEQCFVIPGIITPNNDSYNDTWIIDGLELYPGNEVEIYDRYGRRVFYAKAYDNSWDGTFEGNELPMESYHYFINLNNGTSVLKGNITIVR